MLNENRTHVLIVPDGKKLDLSTSLTKTQPKETGYNTLDTFSQW